MRRREPFLQPDHMQHPALNIHLRHPQAAGLRHSQPMPEHQGDKTRNGILRTLSHFAAFFHAFTFDYCQYSIFAQV